MRQRDYEAYLASPGWKKRQTEYYLTHPRTCTICSTTQGIQLHHHTYDRLGYERDDDLVPLCDEHHELVHRYYSIGGKTLSICTQEVVSYLREEPVLRPKRVAKRIAIAQSLNFISHRP